MENTLDLKVVIKHLVNGTLEENLCVICLAPLNDVYENIFTKVCKEDKEYCIADVLNEVCDIQFLDTDDYNVCIDCFMTASIAYKFYLLSKRSKELLNSYTNEIVKNLDNIVLPEDQKPITLCLSLPYVALETKNYDYDLQGIGRMNAHIKLEEGEAEKVIKKEKTDEEEIVVIVTEDGEKLLYKVDGGEMVLLNEFEKKRYLKANDLKTTKYRKVKKKKYQISPKCNPVEGAPVKLRKKRSPMTQKHCSRCPVKYMFIAKLKEHMKLQHNVDLFVCKVCKAVTEDELEYHNHLKTHTNIHQCAICNTVFKRRETIISHLQWHEKMDNISQSEGAHICEVCGVVLANETSLKEHYESKHYKKFTCFYCGRMYKGELSFEMHIKKHEAQGTLQQRSKELVKSVKVEESAKKQESNKKKCMCPTCGRYFVNERALMWHQRLHNNERPYKCDVCGRGFVSLNRRNQHALCAHTAPTRRCPLCPALFHLRSMVNTHIKKVHLKEHKRRNRVSKYQHVFWRTEPVPIQELSVAVQNDILELQTAKNDDQEWDTGKVISDSHTVGAYSYETLVLPESGAISSAIL